MLYEERFYVEWIENDRVSFIEIKVLDQGQPPVTFHISMNGHWIGCLTHHGTYWIMQYQLSKCYDYLTEFLGNVIELKFECDGYCYKKDVTIEFPKRETKKRKM